MELQRLYNKSKWINFASSKINYHKDRDFSQKTKHNLIKKYLYGKENFISL